MRARMNSKNLDVCEKFFTKASSYRPETSIGFMGGSRDFPFENDLKTGRIISLHILNILQWYFDSHRNYNCTKMGILTSLVNFHPNDGNLVEKQKTSRINELI